MSIKPLPEDVIRRIRSSATVTSLNGVVCALVKNALDAHTTRLNITVDYSRGNCFIEDDGLGILPLEFREPGGLGKQHHTSRHSPEHEFHGANGNFLASVAALSLLTITSHHHLHNSQNSLTILNSRVLARNTPALPEQRLLTFSHGTRVTVRDLFGSMAVRVKQRAVASEKAAVDKEWGRLLRHVAALLLAWPSDVALSIRDTVNNNETRFRPSTLSKLDTVTRSSRILSQSSLVDGLDHVLWTPVGASVGELTIEGCISLSSVANRQAQFISFGIHPVTNEHGTNVLYQEVNRVFINSGFAIEEESTVSRDSPLVVLPTLRQPSDRTSRPKRGLDRWPMFYFRISSSSRTWPLSGASFEDFFNDRNRTLADIIDLLKLVCYEFLKKHHFRPHRVTTSLRGSSSHKQRNEVETDLPSKDAKRPRTVPLTASRSNSTTPISRPESPFDLWQRVKVGRVLEGKTKSGASTPVASHINIATPLMAEGSAKIEMTQPSLRFLDDAGNLLRKPFEGLCSASPPKQESKETTCIRPTIATATKEPCSHPEPLSLARDGEGVSRLGEPTDEAQLSSTTDMEPVSTSQFFKANNSQSQQRPSEWLKGLLSQWENPVFQPAEPPVRRLDDGWSYRAAVQSLDLEAGCSHGTHTSNIKLSGRISKAALVGAEVVSQVDRKFILVKLRRDQISGGDLPGLRTNSVLVLIDQHAADERCRLETLMRDYFHPAKGSKDVVARSEMLENHLQFEFSAKECKLLRKYYQHIRRWGIFYEVEEPESSQWRHKSKQLPKVNVTSLPPSITERCRLEPRLLADLLRQEIWRAEEEGVPPARPVPLAKGVLSRDVDWVSNFQGCPQPILDLLNSRSCRSQSYP
ncbi:DNA mismatch repair protein Mlh3 [Colletotrichum tanaceti]|uniref:DNA mismatch repair protein Mlh3 n=1 Tax=Colletotrichum tanaceti TaxID=1306861 RepID=A0A4U6X823_9PEZI|nr:DNA mismatch repair protein Mlh3 [Colletotrichum tanaceti]TKW49667.1 DNA mismatch repair protein Mlh3 [Colletotrichum tanaceti]